MVPYYYVQKPIPYLQYSSNIKKRQYLYEFIIKYLAEVLTRNIQIIWLVKGYDITLASEMKTIVVKCKEGLLKRLLVNISCFQKRKKR